MKNRIHFQTLFFLVLVMLPLLQGCFSMRYDLSGGVNIDPLITSFSVQYFDNRSQRVVPSLSQQVTDKLRYYVEGNTKLRAVNTIGDLDFSGTIKEYKISPVAISSGDVAAKTRFTITIQVKYNNLKNPDDSWDNSFSRYRDFDSTEDFASVEESLSEEIIDEIIEQIFNKAFVNW